LTGYYTERHNRIVDVVSEAIRTNCNVVNGTIHENTCVKIEEHLCKAGLFKTAIRPDIWYWTETAVGKIAPITYLTLHLVEIKCPWGGI
jgi:hypothetical protein